MRTSACVVRVRCSVEASSSACVLATTTASADLVSRRCQQVHGFSAARTRCKSKSTSTTAAGPASSVEKKFSTCCSCCCCCCWAPGVAALPELGSGPEGGLFGPSIANYLRQNAVGGVSHRCRWRNRKIDAVVKTAHGLPATQACYQHLPQALLRPTDYHVSCSAAHSLLAHGLLASVV
eukprot:353522-Chlamydomonas_euryale.AAC.11